MIVLIEDWERIMSNGKERQRGVRGHLRLHGPAFLKHLAGEDVVARKLDGLLSGLLKLLESDLRTPESCTAFWNGIKRALPGCPHAEDFAIYENILAYGFVHLADRYLRTWEVLRVLTRAFALPAPKKLTVLDVGSGPAPALYAVADFYQELRAFAIAHGVDRLVIEEPDLNAVERSSGMEFFFHRLSEASNRNGPFFALLSNFSAFEPTKMRNETLASVRNYYQDEGRYSEPVPPDGELRSSVEQLHRYQLVIYSNFLTTPSLVREFRQQITETFRLQRPGGVIVVMGGIGDEYPNVYAEVDLIAKAVGYHREKKIQDVVDDSSRQPHFTRIKELANATWNHLTRIKGAATFERKGYPPYWDFDKGIKSLPSFALRVYRRNYTARPTASIE